MHCEEVWQLAQIRHVSKTIDHVVYQITPKRRVNFIHFNRDIIVSLFKYNLIYSPKSEKL